MFTAWGWGLGGLGFQVGSSDVENISASGCWAREVECGCREGDGLVGAPIQQTVNSP